MQAQAAGVSIGVSARLRELPTSFLTQTAISTLLGDANESARLAVGAASFKLCNQTARRWLSG
jgi:hypothetical protein